MRKRPAPLVVASAVSAVEPEPKRMRPSAIDERPVPPFVTVRALVRVSTPETWELVEVASVVTSAVAKRFVEVAFVEVLFVIVTPWKVEEAPFTMRPIVEVGVSAPETTDQSRKAVPI